MAAKPKIPVKPFKDWQPQEIENTFGITRKPNLPILAEITAIKAVLPIPQQAALEKHRNYANWRIEGWNEDEYKFFFISPFLNMIDFGSAYYDAFMQRPMSMVYDNGTKKTEGFVEWMLARGRDFPEQPHFFLHEYKPEKRRDNSPLGQVLIAMIAAQQINEDDLPIYGIYVNGRNWFLVVLEGREYAISTPYVITSDDIFDLFAVLEFVRDKMEELYKSLA